MQNVCFGAMGMAMAFSPASAAAAGANDSVTDARLPGPPIRPCAGQWKLG
jgi:hypothetical protein